MGMCPKMTKLFVTPQQYDWLISQGFCADDFSVYQPVPEPEFARDENDDEVWHRLWQSYVKAEKKRK